MMRSNLLKYGLVLTGMFAILLVIVLFGQSDGHHRPTTIWDTKVLACGFFYLFGWVFIWDLHKLDKLHKVLWFYERRYGKVDHNKVAKEYDNRLQVGLKLGKWELIELNEDYY